MRPKSSAGWNDLLKQLSAVVRLRVQLTRNQLVRRGGLDLVVKLILAAGGIGLVVGGLGAGLWLGGRTLGKAEPVGSLLLWDLLLGFFLMLWAVGFVAELQRSESLDFERFMHLPAPLPAIFGFNYLLSHLTPAILFFGPFFGGAGLGSALVRGPRYLLLLPLVVAELLMVTAWTYCLRGWLSVLLSSVRRKRSFLAAVSLLLLLLCQLPALLPALHRRGLASAPGPATPPPAARPWATLVEGAGLPIHAGVPVLWLPLGAHGLAEGRTAPALLGTAGALLLATLGLVRAYRATFRFYRGEAMTLAALAPPAAPRAAHPSRWMERRLAGLPDPAAAVALATLRSYLRAPEVRMLLGSSVVMVAMALLIAVVKVHAMNDAARSFLATGAVLVPTAMLMQLLANPFGFDRDGFRALVLSPSPRRDWLVGKNLAVLPFALVMDVAMLAAAGVGFGVPSAAALAALFQGLATFLLLCVFGNFTASLLPFRVNPGTLKKARTSARVTLLLFLSGLLAPVLMVPPLLPPLTEWLLMRGGAAPALPVNLLLSALFLAVAIPLYLATLRPAADLLHRREQRVLEAVTRVEE